jgi:hypothetical protein
VVLPHVDHLQSQQIADPEGISSRNQLLGPAFSAMRMRSDFMLVTRNFPHARTAAENRDGQTFEVVPSGSLSPKHNR